MIQIYLADERDFLFRYAEFHDGDVNFIYDVNQYVQDGLKDKKVKIIKIRKWEDK